MLKSFLSKALLMAILAFAITSCADEEIEPVNEEDVAFSSNARATVFNDNLQFNRAKNVSYVAKGDFYVGTAWSRTIRKHIGVYSKDGRSNWRALNPQRNSGLSGFLVNNDAKFIGVMDLLPGMGSQGVAVIYMKDGKLMARRFWRIEPKSEIMKYKTNTREDRPIDITPEDGDLYRIVGRTHKASREECPFDAYVTFIGNRMVFVNESKTRFSIFNPTKPGGRNTGSGQVSRILEANGGFASFAPSKSSDQPNILTTGNGSKFKLYAHWGEFLHTKKNKEAKWPDRFKPFTGCAPVYTSIDQIRCNDDAPVGAQFDQHQPGWTDGSIKASSNPDNDVLNFTNATSSTVVFTVDYKGSFESEDITVTVPANTFTRVKGIVGATFVITNNKNDKKNQGTVNSCEPVCDNPSRKIGNSEVSFSGDNFGFTTQATLLQDDNGKKYRQLRVRNPRAGSENFSVRINGGATLYNGTVSGKSELFFTIENTSEITLILTIGNKELTKQASGQNVADACDK